MVAPPDAGAVSPPDAGFAAPDAGMAVADAGQMVDAGSQPAADAGLAGTGQYGDSCEQAADCASQLCVENRLTGDKVCTIECTADSSCSAGHACLEVPRAGGGTVAICVPSDAGRSCPDGQGDSCIAGICLVHPIQVSRSVCSTPCNSSRACPAGFSCSVANVGGGERRVCTPVGGPCTTQGPSNQCITRWCSTQPQAPSSDGICTNNCRTAVDCPDGWACGWDDAGSGTVVSVCQPLETAGYPVACTENLDSLNNCYSKVCALESASGGYCTAFCMTEAYQAAPSRCPEGWSCVAVPLGEGLTGYACER